MLILYVAVIMIQAMDHRRSTPEGKDLNGFGHGSMSIFGDHPESPEFLQAVRSALSVPSAQNSQKMKKKKARFKLTQASSESRVANRNSDDS